jgi:voltage-gated potassium channel
VSLITLNIIALVLETVEPVRRRWSQGFRLFELSSVAIFSIEYILRIWGAKADIRFAEARFPRLRYAITPLAIMDLLAVLPFYVPIGDGDFRSLRSLRLFRFFRVAKLGRYSRSLQTFGRVFRAKRQDLAVLLFGAGVLLLMASSLMYFAEHEAQPESFSNIPKAMWWGVVTLTTVGYGDIYPITAAGRILGSVVSVLGIGLFALPAGILGAAFVEELRQGRTREPAQQARCPHCGETLSSE